MALSGEFILIAVVVFTAAGTVKGLIGIGMPTIAIALLSQFIDPRMAISLVVFPMLFSNLWQMYRGGSIVETARKYSFFGLALVLSITVTSYYSREVPIRAILMVLGAIIIFYALTGWLKLSPKIPASSDKMFQGIFGLISGTLGGLTAIWAPPMIIYLTSKNIPKEEFIKATGFLITIGTIPLIWGYSINGILTGELATLSALMIIPALSGYAIGEFIRKYVKTDHFYKIIMVVFLVMGINLFIRGFGG